MAEKTEEKVIRRYYVKMGTHVEGDKGNKKVYKKGDAVESEHNLIAMFPEKFSTQPINPGEQVKAEVVNKPKNKKTDPETDKDDDNIGNVDPKGKDITEEFPDAVENNIKVFIKGQWCSIFDLDSETPDVAVNEKGIKKDEVAKALDEILEA